MNIYLDIWHSPVAFFTVVLLIFTPSFAEQSKSDLCLRTCSSSMNDSYVTEYCDQQDFKLQDRCCINGSQVIGIDLQNCGLTELSGLFVNLPGLKVILLQENKLSNTTKAADFEGLLGIEYLGLPAITLCPGGADAWNTVNSTANETLCLEELDYCAVYNVSCPSNSYCENSGPGQNECLCSPGYHGYKCLRQGTFPSLIFTCGMVGSTLVLAGFLWVTQRRNVKKNV